QFRPKTSDPDDALVDYYAKVSISGYNVHMLNLHFADHYDGSIGGSADPSYGLVEATQAFMQSKLESLAAVKTDSDIIVVLAHSTGGDFVDQGRINSTRKTLLLSTADLCVSATTHKFGWWDRYKTYDNGNAAVSYNSGSVGNSGDQNGYMDVHVLSNPTRITIQYISTVKSSRTLHTGVLGSQPDSGKYGTPIIKRINGPWGVVDWNNLPLDGTAGVNNAAYVSQTVPTSMVAGQTASVTVKMKNTGTSTWSPAEAQKLGSLGDSNTWGLVRVNLAGSVAPNQTNSFTFNITAPATAGTYSFQWRMVDDAGSNIGWFGANSALQRITVSSGAMTTVPWVTNLTVAAAGTAITNAGLVVSGVSQEYHATVPAGKIFSQTPGGNTSVARGSSVALAASLGPQPQLVLNNSFETNTASWTLSGSGVARSTAAHAGSGVASLRFNAANSSATQRVAIVSGKTYDISTYAYVSARTAGQVVFDTGDKYDGAGQGQFVLSAANGGWTKYSGSFTATNTSLTVRMFSEGFAGTAYFDQIELKPR
ncbi:MAG: carbohydrate binding domain-containing protein, partial [Pontiellaceae bacterium]|nr:carbohydrate binding domain-containing protein [Pontiellaceae bacterium]